MAFDAGDWLTRIYSNVCVRGCRGAYITAKLICTVNRIVVVICTCLEKVSSSFKSASNNLCRTLANVGRRVATSQVDPHGLAELVACRLIPLNKCPGVRPISIAILKIIGSDVEEAAGPLQVCAGQEGGCEAEVHAMRQIFSRARNRSCSTRKIVELPFTTLVSSALHWLKC